jgi:hypothetical protein
MRANGAEIAAQKSTIVSALANNELNLRTAVRSPATTQKGLDFLTTRLKGTEGRSLRQKADKLLGRFINDD